MIRFLIDQFRNMPGPLKKPRILVADLTEEVLDIAAHFLKKGKSDSSGAECGDPCASSSVATAPDASATSSGETAAKPGTDEKKDTTKKSPSSSDKATSDASKELDPRLSAAIAIPSNVRKQEFKVLAILWDASIKNTGALSAKAISKRGEDVLKVQIRHENVRKVIRMRLENYVNVHAQGVGNGTVYNYELADAGVEYFVSTYLNK